MKQPLKYHHNTVISTSIFLAPPCFINNAVTCRGDRVLVFAVLGEGHISRQGHPVQLRQLSSL